MNSLCVRFELRQQDMLCSATDDVGAISGGETSLGRAVVVEVVVVEGATSA